MRNNMTIKEATESWVREFNAFPQSMLEKLKEIDPCDWSEITVPTKGDRVYVYDSSEYGEVMEYDEDEELYTVELDNDETVKVSASEFELKEYGYFPMWGTLWQFNERIDDYWLTDMDGIRKMSECGFHIYESNEFGIFFGIDGAGYDFYESHWIPLYKARGLHWHNDPEEENEK